MTIFIALLSACAWSIFDLQRKLLVNQVSPISLAMWLSVASIPIYAVLCIYFESNWPTMGYWRPAAGSLLVSSIATISFIYALKVGQIALLMPILALTPVVSAIFSYWWLGDTLSTKELLAIISIVTILFLLHGGANFHWYAGASYMMVVALGWGLGTVFDRWALGFAQPFSHAMFQSTGNLLLFILLLASRGELRHSAVTGTTLKNIVLAASVFIIAVSTQLYALQDLYAGIVESIKRGVGTLAALIWGIYFFRNQ